MSLMGHPVNPTNKDKARDDAYTLINHEKQRKLVSEITKDKKRYKAALKAVGEIGKDKKEYAEEEMKELKAEQIGINNLMRKAKRL